MDMANPRPGLTFESRQAMEDFFDNYSMRIGKKLSKFHGRRGNDTDLCYQSLEYQCACYGTYESRSKDGKGKASMKCGCPMRLKISAGKKAKKLCIRDNGFCLDHNEECDRTNKLSQKKGSDTSKISNFSLYAFFCP